MLCEILYSKRISIQIIKFYIDFIINIKYVFCYKFLNFLYINIFN